MVAVGGIHGTTATRAKGIQESGFWVSDGERGFGVYFWRENAYSRELAIGWYLSALKRPESNYHKDKDKRCAVISAVIATGEDEWLDLTDPDIEDGIIGLYKKNGYADIRAASKLYEEFCQITQEELGIEIKFVQTRVFAPKDAREWPRQSIGMPVCYVVKDTSSIVIKEVEILDLRETGS